MTCPLCAGKNEMAYSALSNGFVCLEANCGFELEMEPDMKFELPKSRCIYAGGLDTDYATKLQKEFPYLLFKPSQKDVVREGVEADQNEGDRSGKGKASTDKDQDKPTDDSAKKDEPGKDKQEPAPKTEEPKKE